MGAHRLCLLLWLVGCSGTSSSPVPGSRSTLEGSAQPPPVASVSSVLYEASSPTVAALAGSVAAPRASAGAADTAAPAQSPGAAATSGPGAIDETRALAIARDFFAKRAEASSYLLDTGRVTDGGECWNVWFKHHNWQKIKPSEALVKVDKATGQAERQPLR